jgi:outer membrane lipopolysaccharide assembly protein LptE/RlpB
MKNLLPAAVVAAAITLTTACAFRAKTEAPAKILKEGNQP